MSGRCCSCDAKMTDFEMTRKYTDSGRYVELCNKCIKTIPNFPQTTERYDLLNTNDIQYEFDESLDYEE